MAESSIAVELDLCGAKGVIVHQPATSGLDAKQREWESSDGFYFSCGECSNSGIPHPDFEAAFDEALEHLASH